MNPTTTNIPVSIITSSKYLSMNFLMGFPKKKKSVLREIAVGMYLVYDGQRGIYGPSHRGKKRPIKSPLAAQFDISPTATAPEWFSRSVAIMLPLLQRAIEIINVRYGVKGAQVQEASGEALATQIAKEGVEYIDNGPVDESWKYDMPDEDEY